MNKTAFVTGATKGIGQAIALRLAREGYHLYLLGRDQQALAQLAEECQRQGVKTRYAAGDLLDGEFTANAVGEALAEFEHIDVLINNAGVASREAVQSADLDVWQDVMDLNFTAVIKPLQPD